MRRLWVALISFSVCSTAAMAATLRVEYRWSTNQAVEIAVYSQDGDPQYSIFSGENYAACGGTYPYSSHWGTSAITVSPATSNGAVGVTITIDPFYPTPGASFQAFPWPNSCEYQSPGYVPTAITVTAYLDDVEVSRGSRDYPVFPGLTQKGWEEVASYPIQPRMIFELDENQLPQKALLHKYRTDDTSGWGGYYSIYQQPQAADTDPAVMRIHGGVEENSAPVVHDVWLRIIDPPSSAPYESPSSGNDNLDAAAATMY
jgi:hypothetical protein